MRKRTSRAVHRWLKDMGLAAMFFLLLPLLAAGMANPRKTLSFNEALAGEVIATRAIEVTSPPGPAAENAIVAVAQLRPADVPLQMRRMNELVILGLAFSMVMACNMALWRHLRRVSVTSRREDGRRRA